MAGGGKFAGLGAELGVRKAELGAVAGDSVAAAAEAWAVSVE